MRRVVLLLIVRRTIYLKFNAASAKMTEAANVADGAGQAPTTSKRSAMRIQMQMPRPFVHYTR